MSHDLPHSLTKKQERAALLVSEDSLTDEQIAVKLGISRATLKRWKNDRLFAARVTQVTAEYRQKIVAEGIANRQNRVDALNDAFVRMEQVIAERGADPLMRNVAGGQSGLLVAKPVFVKIMSGGERETDGADIFLPEKAVQLEHEYAVDTGLLRERRATLQQAAQELGQWSEKTETNTTINIVAEVEALLDKPIPIRLVTDSAPDAS